MQDGPVIDPMVLNFERQGFFLSPRQLEFCRFMFQYANAIKAAKKAGYPEPRINGPALFGMFKTPMDVYREEAGLDREGVLATYRRQMNSERRVLTNSDELKANPNIEPTYEYEPDENLAGKGAKGLRDVLGLDKAKGLDVNMNATVGLPPSTREMLDDAYDQD